MGSSDFLIGFSTGAIAPGDVPAAVEIIRRKRITAIELSALRAHELDPLLESLSQLDLGQFEYIAVHAPSQFDGMSEHSVAARLRTFFERGWMIVLHPDALSKFDVWRSFGKQLCIENMDKRKRMGRTADELSGFLELLPEASVCLDLAHIRQVDPTMSQAVRLISKLGHRIAQLHLSDIDAAGRHRPLTNAAILAYQQVVPLIPRRVPVILESVVQPECIEREIEAVRLGLPWLAQRRLAAS